MKMRFIASLLAAASVLGLAGLAVSHRSTQAVAQILPLFTDDEAATIAVVERANPAVVSIVASKDLEYIVGGGPAIDPFGDLFNDPFFNQFGPQFRMPVPHQPRTPPKTIKKKQQIGAGTGFFFDPSGLILTNRHVVADTAAAYTVVMSDGKKLSAKVLGRDPVHDLAVVKVEGGPFSVVPFGDSEQVRVGQTVIAIGNSLGRFDNTVTRGVISGRGRSIVATDGRDSSQLLDILQTDAAINPGNSGGPLFNLRGEVIGVNAAIVQGSQNIGFAIPINTAKTTIDAIKRYGKVVRAYLGVRYQIITPDLKEELKLPVEDGAVLTGDDKNPAVAPKSPAAVAGLKKGDIITQIEGINITTDRPLAAALGRYQPNTEITLTILRDGKQKEVKVKLGSVQE